MLTNVYQLLTNIYRYIHVLINTEILMLVLKTKGATKNVTAVEVLRVFNSILEIKLQYQQLPILNTTHILPPTCSPTNT